MLVNHVDSWPSSLFVDDDLKLLINNFLSFRSVANPMGSQNKHIVKSLFVEANGMTDQEFNDEVVELIPISDEDSHDATETFVKSDYKEDQSKVKHLILFEDVDITFLEDRGFLAAIQQIAKTAKGPIILTSNSKRVYWLK